MNNNDGLESAYQFRWQESLAKLTELRFRKKRLSSELDECIKKRAKLKAQGGVPQTEMAALKYSIGRYCIELKFAAADMKRHQLTHERLCQDINREVGKRTVQLWQRARRRDRPRTKHIPVPVSPPASPDANYGLSGGSCGGC